MTETINLGGEAWRKLALGYELHTAVYIYGATGFGKTTLVRQFLGARPVLWIDCRDIPLDIKELIHELDPAQCLVIDNIHLLHDPGVQDALTTVMNSRASRIILIGRVPTPVWLTPLLPNARLIVITEEELRFTPAHVDQLAHQYNLTVSPDDLRYLAETSEGNVLVLGLIMARMSKGEQLGLSLEEQVIAAFGSYLERYVINQWSCIVREFLMQVSVVSSFTLPMAESITGDDCAAAVLEQAMTSGNIIYREGEVYTIRRILRETLFSGAVKELGRQRVNRCLYNAARYCESNDDVLQALALYEQCGEKDCIKSLLIRNARRHPGAGYYYELRSYYMALDDEEIASSPVLMSAVSMLYSIMMDQEHSEYWYERLRSYAQQVHGGDRQDAMSQLLSLDLGLPHRGSASIVSLIKAMPAMLMRNEAELRLLSLTNNQPSVMNGGKDFCDWSKTDKLLAETIGGTLEALLGRMGAGLVHIALGESQYEKGADPYTVLTHLLTGQTQSEGRGQIETTFASVGLQVRLAMTAGKVNEATALLDGIERRARQECARKLLPSIDALRCRVRLMCNDTAAVTRWMAAAPNEKQEFNTLERYRYLTKIRCYLSQHRDMEALMLIERMAAYADYSHRTYIKMECGLLRAIAQKRLGMVWKPGLLETLALVSEYKFVRLVSEEGAAIAPLLHEVRAAFLEQSPSKRAWIDQVMSETELMNRRFPAYMIGDSVDLSAFSETGLAVLRMLASGLSTKEIGEQLGISQRTVKYHSSENYRKLGAKNLVDAVQIARALNIL